MVAGGLMMESNRQLNHALKMQPHRREARHGVPDILKNFMSVEKMAVIKKTEALLELLAMIVERHRHSELASLQPDSFVILGVLGGSRVLPSHAVKCSPARAPGNQFEVTK